MTGFQIEMLSGTAIRFRLYHEEAPQTVAAFIKALPFSRVLFHARISGQEIWTDDAPIIDVPQENASVFTEPGEMVIGPLYPTRNKIIKCIGIFYGEGKLLDCGNIFARVFPEDMGLLKELGEKVWKKGGQELRFTVFEV